MSLIQTEPVAIVGMGCRLPGGVNSPAELWELLVTGQDAVGELPPGRWAEYEQPGSTAALALRGTTRRGAFLEDAAAFDADFFGVTPREAAIMDPQQRLVLEVTWEALADAGIPPYRLAGSDAGVFVGVGSDDYGRQMLEDLPRIEAWTGIGAAPCAVANRVSYLLDLRGPSFAVDTACSSSLVAVHLAAQSLRLGESTLAIAAGVNLIAAPGLTMVLDAAGAISPDGQSKPFDAAADGYGRGEGVGVVVLKRLADARRDGDRVLAVLRGSSVNQDGRTAGIMAPSSDAQAQVARQALGRAGISPLTVGYVEAHGTGTRAGDPIEVAALEAVYGRGRPAGSPCLIGSVKGNIGHLEAGAGVVGVIKAVLSVQHGEIPPSGGFATPNPDIPWDRNGLQVVNARTPWPAAHPVRRAAVSSFGYGGTVAHALIEQPPAVDRVPGPATAGGGGRLFALSGTSSGAVNQYAGRLADWLDGPGAAARLDDLAYTLLARRSHLPHRTALVAEDREALVTGLRAVAAGRDAGGVVAGGTLPGDPERAVWVFSGHGSQWIGMGTELLDMNRVFTDVIDRLGPVFQQEIGFSPRQVLVDGDLKDVDRIQPMIFAVQVALAAVWRSLGLAPGAVIGHSVGEIAAAVQAGVFDLLDGARLVCRRSKLLRRVAGRGAMAMVGLPFREVEQRLAGRTDVTAAIESSAVSTVVAGQPQAVAVLAEQWRAQGLMVREVASDVAFHSVQMDPLLTELAESVSDLTPAAPAVPLYSTALADPRSTAARNGSYWARNLRNPVRMASAIAAAAEDGHRIYLEISTHPVVTHSIAETLSELGHRDVLVTGTMRRSRPEWSTLLESFAALYCAGTEIDFAEAVPRSRVLTLPTIAWQHKRFWRPASSQVSDVRGHDVDSENLLGQAFTVAGATGQRIWQTRLDYDNRPYPGEHPVQGVEIIPAAVLLNTFFAAAQSGELSEVDLKVPVSLTAPRQLQVIRHGDALRLASRLIDAEQADAEHDDRAWQTHSTATAAPGIANVSLPAFDLAETRLRCARRMDPSTVLDRLHAVGVANKGFPWVVDELVGSAAGTEVLARVRTNPDTEGPAASWGSAIDAVLTVAPLVFPGAPILRMPAHIRRVAVAAQIPAAVLIHVELGAGGSSRNSVDVVVTDEHGSVVCVLDGLRFGTLVADPDAAVSPRRLAYRISWHPMSSGAAPSRPLRTVVLVGDGGPADALASAVRMAGARCVQTAGTDGFAAIAGDLGSDDTVLVLAGGSADRAGGTADQAARSAWLLASIAQLISTRMPTRPPRLWAVTTGLLEARDRNSLVQAPVWGLGRVIGGEHPELWGGVVDLDARPDGTDLTRLVRLLRQRPEQDVSAIRDGAVSVARLVPIDGAPSKPAFECRADASYLITGGLGVLGREVAAWLAGRGARRIILAARTPLPPRDRWDTIADRAACERIDAVRAIEALGVTVKVVALDITDREQAARVLDPSALDLPPIRGVVHAAGVLDNRMLRDLDERSLRTVMSPKVAGAMVLDELFPPGTLDFLALFSSVGLLLGLTGQSSYASANAFLDGLAGQRAAAGDNTISFGWTSWRGLGMAVNDVVDQELADRGVGSISPAEAFSAWEFAACRDVAHVPVLRTVGPPARPLPILSELAGSVGEDAEPAGTPCPSGTVPADLDPEQLQAWLVEQVAVEVGAELGIAPAELDVRRPLAEIGLDSLMTMAIRRRLEKRFRLSLPATLLWNHPTVVAVVGFLSEQLG